MTKLFLVALFTLGAVLCWGQGELAINEIMYNSLGVDQEWVEFKNLVYGDVYLDSTWILTDGEGDFNFPEIVVRGGEFLTVIVDTAWEGDSVVIHFTPDVDATGNNIKFANTGDDVILLHIVGTDTIVVDSVTYNPNWASASNGGGPSLERINAFCCSNDSTNWGACFWDWGSPEMENTLTGIDEKALIPRTLKISAEPNPFNAACAIQIYSGSPATARILDVLGKTISYRSLTLGTTSIVWEAETAPSGVYFLSVWNKSEHLAIPIMLVR